MNYVFGFIAFLAFSLPALAGFDHGSGGNVVYCSKDVSHGSFETLDLYEGKTIYQFIPELPDASLGVLKIVETLIHRLHQFDSKRESRYLEWLNSFESDSRYLTHTPLNPVNDYGYIPIPTGCFIRQAVLQRQANLPFEGKYIIDNDIFARMIPTEKAALILHEIVYRDALSRGQTNSIFARYFTALIASDKMAKISQEQYIKSLRASSFDMWLHQVPLPNAVIDEYRYYDNVSGTHKEMDSFCQKINPTSKAACPFGNDVYLSPMGKHFLEIENEEERTVWCDSESYAKIYGQVEQSSPATIKSAHVICRTYRKDSSK